MKNMLVENVPPPEWLIPDGAKAIDGLFNTSSRMKLPSTFNMYVGPFIRGRDTILLTQILPIICDYNGRTEMIDYGLIETEQGLYLAFDRADYFELFMKEKNFNPLLFPPQMKRVIDDEEFAPDDDTDDRPSPKPVH